MSPTWTPAADYILKDLVAKNNDPATRNDVDGDGRKKYSQWGIANKLNELFPRPDGHLYLGQLSTKKEGIRKDHVATRVDALNLVLHACEAGRPSLENGIAALNL
jgi:hypothetical protein